ncbi:MAG: hypothetical protein ACI8WB_001025 [Phenylobacterium sp.]|jgi:hypothetical protein
MATQVADRGFVMIGELVVNVEFDSATALDKRQLLIENTLKGHLLADLTALFDAVGGDQHLPELVLELGEMQWQQVETQLGQRILNAVQHYYQHDFQHDFQHYFLHDPSSKATAQADQTTEQYAPKSAILQPPSDIQWLEHILLHWQHLWACLDFIFQQINRLLTEPLTETLAKPLTETLAERWQVLQQALQQGLEREAPAMVEQQSAVAQIIRHDQALLSYSQSALVFDVGSGQLSKSQWQSCLDVVAHLAEVYRLSLHRLGGGENADFSGHTPSNSTPSNSTPSANISNTSTPDVWIGQVTGLLNTLQGQAKQRADLRQILLGLHQSITAVEQIHQPSAPQTEPTSLPEQLPEQLSKPLSKPSDKAQPPEVFAVTGAGIVLLGPYLPRFFSHLDYLQADAFKHSQLARRAVQVLHYLASGEQAEPQQPLVLFNLLCGLAADDLPLVGFELGDNERRQCQQLTTALTRHWPGMAAAKPATIRQRFLHRPGQLTRRKTDWLLTPQPQLQDVLLQDLPWGVSHIYLPWMVTHLAIDWSSDDR